MDNLLSLDELEEKHAARLKRYVPRNDRQRQITRTASGRLPLLPHNAIGHRILEMFRGTFSGMTTGNTPPKNRQAASKPQMTSSVVWVKVGHTN